MTVEMHEYERMRARLFGGFDQNLFARLLKDRTALTGPLQGTPHEFCQILYQLTKGELNRPNDAPGLRGRRKGEQGHPEVQRRVPVQGRQGNGRTDRGPDRRNALHAVHGRPARQSASCLLPGWCPTASGSRKSTPLLPMNTGGKSGGWKPKGFRRSRRISRESTLEAVLTAIEKAQERRDDHGAGPGRTSMRS